MNKTRKLIDLTGETIRPNNIRNAGRKKLPVESKKVASSVYLIPADIKELELRHGSLTKALETVLLTSKAKTP